MTRRPPIFPLLGLVALLSLTACDGEEPSTQTVAPPAPTATKTLAATAEAAAEGDVWTCTMHPEVRSDSEGRCPKCQMILVKAEAATEAAPAGMDHEGMDHEAGAMKGMDHHKAGASNTGTKQEG